MQKDVDACRQWVIFLFINEWAGLGKGSFVDYHHSPMWQASSLKGLSPHWQPSPCSVFLFILGSQPNGGANLSPELSLTEDPSSLNLRDLLCFRKISSVNSRCPCFSSPLLFPLSLQPGRISHYPPIEPLPSLGFGSEYRFPPPHLEPLPALLREQLCLWGPCWNLLCSYEKLFLASPYSDHSITQVCLGFGHRVPSIPLLCDWSVLLLEVEFWLHCVIVSLICERPSC